MGLKSDLDRFREIGEEKRQDLTDFIEKRKLEARGGEIRVPIKIVNLPEFAYDQWDMGGVGQGEGNQGQPIDADIDSDKPGEGDEGDSDEAGEGEGQHGHYEMDPEEFSKELDEELGLDLEPKGKQIKEEKEGDLVDLARAGPDSTLDFERMFKKALKRELSFFFDEDYLREVLKVDGMGPQNTFEWAREENIPVSKEWIDREYQNIPSRELSKYNSISDIEKEMKSVPNARDVNQVPLRKQDKKHKYPEVVKEYEKSAVIVFIRDVSGSMGEEKRNLVERVFTPLDWYLTGKYDNAEFIYIAHDSESWRVDREDFFGIQSGGGTQISTAYELTQKILDKSYPWSEWNRYVFASGDGENWRDDTKNNVIPLMKDIDANLHAYLQVAPKTRHGVFSHGKHGRILEDEFDESSNVAVTTVHSADETSDALYEILSQEDNND